MVAGRRKQGDGEGEGREGEQRWREGIHVATGDLVCWLEHGGVRANGREGTTADAA